jgi:hypothetical protein
MFSPHLCCFVFTAMVNISVRRIRIFFEKPAHRLTLITNISEGICIKTNYADRWFFVEGECLAFLRCVQQIDLCGFEVVLMRRRKHLLNKVEGKRINCRLSLYISVPCTQGPTVPIRLTVR